MILLQTWSKMSEQSQKKQIFSNDVTKAYLNQQRFKLFLYLFGYNSYLNFTTKFVVRYTKLSLLIIPLWAHLITSITYNAILNTIVMPISNTFYHFHMRVLHLFLNLLLIRHASDLSPTYLPCFSLYLRINIFWPNPLNRWLNKLT